MALPREQCMGWDFLQKVQLLSCYRKLSFRNIVISWKPMPRSNDLDGSVSRHQAQFNRWTLYRWPGAHEET